MTDASCRGRNAVQLGGTTGKETEGLTGECRERSGGELKRKRSRGEKPVRFLGREPGQSEHVGAAGRRRQFRADRRCNHPRPCPLLLSGPSGGLFSLSLRIVPCRGKVPRLSYSALARRPSRPDPSGRELDDRERYLSVAFGCIRTAASHATDKLVGLFQLLSLRPSHVALVTPVPILIAFFHIFCGERERER